MLKTKHGVVIGSAAPDSILSRPAFRRLLGDISRSTEHRWRRDDPTFPRVVQIGPGRTGVLESEAQQFIQRLAAERDRDGQ